MSTIYVHESLYSTPVMATANAWRSSLCAIAILISLRGLPAVLILAFGIAALLTGCESDDAWPDDYGNRDTLVINNTDDAIVIEYREKEAEVGITLFDAHTDTIQAHSQKSISLYFNSRGNGDVTARQGDREKTFTVPVKNPVLSVDSTDFD